MPPPVPTGREESSESGHAGLRVCRIRRGQPAEKRGRIGATSAFPEKREPAFKGRQTFLPTWTFRIDETSRLRMMDGREITAAVGRSQETEKAQRQERQGRNRPCLSCVHAFSRTRAVAEPKTFFKEAGFPLPPLSLCFIDGFTSLPPPWGPRLPSYP
jgi:hypothetical protein